MPISRIVNGIFSSYAISPNGQCYATGLNDDGQLGVGDNINKYGFTPVQGLAGQKVVQVAAAVGHTVVITEGGQCYATGLNEGGQLGLRNTVNKNQFTLVQDLVGQKIVQVVVGDGHTVVITEDGQCYSTGDNQYGQLGLGLNDDGPLDVVYSEDKNQFTPVLGLGSHKVVQVAAGRNHTVALTKNGQCFATGDNQCGQLGVRVFPKRYSFRAVQGLAGQKVVQVVAGADHTVVITEGGQCYAAGMNDDGQLGVGDFDNKNQFTPVQGLAGRKVEQVVTTDFNTFALTADGQCYATGQNIFGQLGLGHNVNKNQFTPVQGLAGKQVVQVVAGRYHTVALTASGQCFATGNGNLGQLGVGNTANKSQFTPVQGLAGQQVIQLAAGYNHTVALTADGQCCATGWNEYGPLGVGDNAHKNQFTLALRLPCLQQVSSLQESAIWAYIKRYGYTTEGFPKGSEESLIRAFHNSSFVICKAHGLLRLKSTMGLLSTGARCECYDCRQLAQRTQAPSSAAASSSAAAASSGSGSAC